MQTSLYLGRRQPFQKMATQCKKHRGSLRLHNEANPNAITAEDLRDQWDRQGGRCYYFQTPMRLEDLYQRGLPLTPSVERLDSTRGYTPDNIVIATRLANLGKNTSTEAAMQQALAKIRQHWA